MSRQWTLKPDPKWPSLIVVVDESGKEFEQGFKASDPEEMAKARLIAAAPEMLEALIKVQKWLTENGGATFGVESAIGNAIAKAEGRVQS